MPIIDHDPDEVPRKRTWFWDVGIFWLMWVVVAVAWIGHFYFSVTDWDQIALGALTGMVLVIWGTWITDDKVPASWRGKPPRDS